MIKIYASDLDHTLLNDASELPDEIEVIIDQIRNNNGIFIAASGRALLNIETKFGKLSDKISIISDNGAVLKHNGEILHIEKMSEEAVISTVNVLRNALDSTTVVITPTKYYVESDNVEHHNYLYEYYDEVTFVDDLTQYTKDVIKITALSPSRSHQNFVEFVDGNLDDSIYPVEAGTVWIDVMNKSVNKGRALKKLMDLEGVHKDEVVAFGDYYNDKEMVTSVKYGYFVENAPQDLKDLAYEVIGTNNEKAVITTILKHINSK